MTMARRNTARRVWESKAEVLARGDLVSALTYERARQDKKGQGKSISDQRVLNHSEVARHGWRLGESFWDNDRSATKERPDFERLMSASALASTTSWWCGRSPAGNVTWRSMYRSGICATKSS